MKTFKQVVEEEKAHFVGTWLPNGKESEQPQMESDFDQAMHKAALAVVEDIRRNMENTLQGRFTIEDHKILEYLSTLRKQLTDKE